MASDLSEIIKKCNLKITRDEIEKMINEVDYHDNGKISWCKGVYYMGSRLKKYNLMRIRITFIKSKQSQDSILQEYTSFEFNLQHLTLLTVQKFEKCNVFTRFV